MASFSNAADRRRAQKHFSDALNNANKIYIATISPVEIALAFEICQTAAVSSAHHKVLDAIFGGPLSIVWQTKNGRVIFPQLQELISEEGSRFGRQILVTLDALGFVPIKVAPDEASGLKFGFVPDFTQNDIHLVQNKRTQKLECVLYRHNRGRIQNNGFNNISSTEGTYDDDVYFVYENMPSADGHLRSKILSLERLYKTYSTRLRSSIAMDLRTITNETAVRLRDEDGGDAIEDVTTGGNRSMAQSFAETRDIYEKRLRGIAHFGGTGNAGHNDVDRGGGLAIVPHIRSHSLVNEAGIRTYTELPTDVEIVPLAAPRPASDLVQVTKLFTSAAAQAVGVPPSLLSDNTVSHGKGVEELNSELNKTVNRRGQFIRSIMQRAVDVTYSTETKKKIRRFMLRGLQRKRSLHNLDELLRSQQRRINKEHGPLPAQPLTVNDIVEQKTVSEDEFANIWDENRIHVVLAADIRISVERIREMHEELGFIDVNTKRTMLANTLNLSRELLETGTGQPTLMKPRNKETKPTKPTGRTRDRSRSRERDENKKEKEGKRG
jgi:hypothetical protein